MFYAMSSMLCFVIITEHRFLAILRSPRVQLINWGETYVLLFMLWRMERIVEVHGKKKKRLWWQERELLHRLLRVAINQDSFMRVGGRPL